MERYAFWPNECPSHVSVVNGADIDRLAVEVVGPRPDRPDSVLLVPLPGNDDDLRGAVEGHDSRR